MGDVLAFVDSIDDAPTVLLDLNDEERWWIRSFEAPLPRLRRALTSNAMSDGINVSTANYDARTLALTFDLICLNSDEAGEQIQKLIRLIDRPESLLMYQRDDATHPVWFEVYRSDVSALTRLPAARAYESVTVELLAKPFALGGRQSLAPATVVNDPATSSYFDAVGVIGDVPAPAVLEVDGTIRDYMLFATRQHGTPSDLTWFQQCEDMAMGASTSVPAGAAGGGFSGAGSGGNTNYAYTTGGAGGSLTSARLSWPLASTHNTAAKRRALSGSYRVLVALRRLSSAAHVDVRAQVNGVYGDTVRLEQTVERILVDLGVFWIGPDGNASAIGYGAETGASVGNLNLYSLESGGSSGIYWDVVYLVPADESSLILGSTSTRSRFVVDGVNGRALALTGDAFDGTGYTWADTSFAVSGGFPALVPDRTNRVYVVTADGANRVANIGHSLTITAHYWPRYLHIRPVAS